MLEKKILVINDIGLSAEVCSELVETTNQFESNVILGKEGIKVNGKSVLGIMTLSVKRKDELIINCNGNDEREAVEAITNKLKELEVI